MELSIIIPAHNEEHLLPLTITQLEREIRGIDYQIIVVNDHSTDSTENKVKKLMNNFKNIKLVSNILPKGFANALITGFSCSDSELVLPVMSDLCDDPNSIYKMYKKIKEGYDIVCGSRYIKGGKRIGGPFLKMIFSKLIGVSLNLLIGIPTTDITNSFKMYRKETINNVKIQGRHFEVSMELCLKAFLQDYKIAEIPTRWRARTTGKSKFSILKIAPHYIYWFLWSISKRVLITKTTKKNSQSMPIE